MPRSKAVALACLLALAMPAVSHAVITFTQLADDIFVVSHRVKFIGSRGQAMRLVYEKAASLCVAAGYTHLEILDQESEAVQEDDSANASVRVQLFQAEGAGRIDCEKNASGEYVTAAGNKLAKMGFQPPPPAEEAAQTAPAAAGTPTGICTIEQIVAMVKAGLGLEQIKAACPAQ